MPSFDELLYSKCIEVTDARIKAALIQKTSEDSDDILSITIDCTDQRPLESMFIETDNIIPLIGSTASSNCAMTVDGRMIDLYSEPYLEAYKQHTSDFVNTFIVPEPILSETSFRYTTYPIKYKTVWDNYQIQQKNNWVVQEIDFSKDVKDWEDKLSNNDRYFLMHVLAMFASFDGIVNVNIKQNLIDLVKIKEAECGYGKQFDMENVHGETYSLMIDIFIKDRVLQDKLIDSIRTMPAIKAKVDWCKKWIECDKTFAHKLVAFSIVEGVFFSGSFASIYWLKTRSGGIMPGLLKSNRFISRDEALHVDLACILYALLKNRLQEAVVYEIMNEAVEIEDFFINCSLPCKLIGMNAELMSQYIRYVSDRLLVQLGYNKLYNVTNPFEFMNKIDVYDKNNFFESRTDSYQDSKIDNPRVFQILNEF